MLELAPINIIYALIMKWALGEIAGRRGSILAAGPMITDLTASGHF
jgi:hypothetical protein